MITDKLIKQTGKRLTKLRKELEMSQRAFATIISNSKKKIWWSSVAEIENGKRRMPLDFAMVLHDKWGVSLNWIYLGKGRMF